MVGNDWPARTALRGHNLLLEQPVDGMAPDGMRHLVRPPFDLAYLFSLSGAYEVSSVFGASPYPTWRTISSASVVGAPTFELLERGEKAIDEVIDVMDRATIEAVLRISAEQLAGPKMQGRRADDRALYWHGSQTGRAARSPIPAYDAMQCDQSLADRMLAIMMNGVSTRRYEKVLGVDEDGKRCVLGARSGASENAAVTTALLEDLVALRIRLDRRRLFVVDGAKALRSAIDQVLGAGNEV